MTFANAQNEEKTKKKVITFADAQKEVKTKKRSSRPQMLKFCPKRSEHQKKKVIRKCPNFVSNKVKTKKKVPGYAPASRFEKSSCGVVSKTIGKYFTVEQEGGRGYIKGGNCPLLLPWLPHCLARGP